MKKKILDIIKITGKRNFLYLIGLFFCLILLSFLEFIGIGAIPVFMSAILDPQIISSKLDNPFLLNFINETNQSDLIIYFLFLLLFFKDY